MSKLFHIGMEINMISNLIHREIDNFMLKKSAQFTDENITGINGRVIGFLYLNMDKDIFQKDIEEVLRIRRSTVSTLLKGMEEKGLIIRQSVAFDARLKKIILTEKAIKVQLQIAEDIDSFESKIREGITDEELEHFKSVLSKIEKNLH